VNLSYTVNNGATSGQDHEAQVISLTQNDADADLFGLRIESAATTNAAAGSYEALIKLVNAEDTAAAVTDAILIDSTSGTTGDITDAIDVSDANITNALNVAANFILLDGTRIFEGTTGTLTVEDTAGNDLLTIADAGTTGNLVATGTGSFQGTTLGLNNDADSDCFSAAARTSTLTSRLRTPLPYRLKPPSMVSPLSTWQVPAHSTPSMLLIPPPRTRSKPPSILPAKSPVQA
jgi:hypothetical protein